MNIYLKYLQRGNGKTVTIGQFTECCDLVHLLYRNWNDHSFKANSSIGKTFYRWKGYVFKTVKCFMRSEEICVLTCAAS